MDAAACLNYHRCQEKSGDRFCTETKNVLDSLDVVWFPHVPKKVSECLIAGQSVA